MAKPIFAPLPVLEDSRRISSEWFPQGASCLSAPDRECALKRLCVSVVIPSYNNASALPETLLALKEQTVPLEQFEVIIIDDGSTDATEQIVTDLALPESFRYIRQCNRGAAVARNHGASLAAGDLLVFLDSDVVPDAHLLQAHLDVHQRHANALCVGRTRSMAPENRSRFYKVMGQRLFAFDLGEEERFLSFQDLVSRNLSMPRSAFLALGGFNEGFPNSGFEDTEFAFRAVQAGYELWYSPTASGVHKHVGSLEDVGRHMYQYQISAALLFSLHPQARGKFPHLIDKEPVAWGEDDARLIARKTIRWVSAHPPVRSLWHMGARICEQLCPCDAILRKLYWQVLGTYLFLGYRKGRRRYQLDG